MARSKAMIGRTSAKSPKAKFLKAPSSHPDGTGGSGVRVSAGKGGAGRIGADHCPASRGAPNVRESYGKSY